MAEQTPTRARPYSDSEIVEAAVQQGAEAYFDACRDRVEPFVRTKFRFPGSWATNRVAFGWDLLRSPINLLWAPIYVLASLTRALAGLAGLPSVVKFLRGVPPGLTTRVHRSVAQAIYSDLLKCSPTQPSSNALRESIVQALRRAGVSDESSEADVEQRIHSITTDAITELNVTRTASADVTNTTLSTLVGAFAFKKFTPGGIAIGFLLAGWVARNRAVSDSIFGETLGGFFYGLFPPDPGGLTIALSILVVLLVMAVFASFSGLLTDPIQARLGIHQRRLHSLIDNFEADFNARTAGGFKPRDQYLARLLEAVDAVRSPFL